MSNDRSLTVIVVAAFFINLILLPTFTSKGISPAAYGQQGGGLQQITLANQAMDLPYLHMKTFPFDVPPNAQDPKVSGTYEIRGENRVGQVGIYIVDSSQCTTSLLSENPSNCQLYTAENAQSGNLAENAPTDSVVVPLDPGKSYYLIFDNQANGVDVFNVHYNFLVRAHFVLQYN